MDGNLAALTISAEDSAVAFEPDESIGAAVLAHVHDVRDRLALACVSREWRRVAATEGSWGVAHDELVMKGELAKRLTDERLERLMRYYGRLKRVELRGFPPTFTGTFMTKRFTSLHRACSSRFSTRPARWASGASRRSSRASACAIGQRRNASIACTSADATRRRMTSLFLLESGRRDAFETSVGEGCLDLWACESDLCVGRGGEGKSCSSDWVSFDSAFVFGGWRVRQDDLRRVQVVMELRAVSRGAAACSTFLRGFPETAEIQEVGQLF